MSDVNRELLYAGKAKDIYKSENENPYLCYRCQSIFH